MKDLFEKGIIADFLSCFNNQIINNIDKNKLSVYIKEISLGIKNYTIFQNFLFYKWPYWLYDTYSPSSNTYYHIKPPLLLNNNNRDWISYSYNSSIKDWIIA